MACLLLLMEFYFSYRTRLGDILDAKEVLKLSTFAGEIMLKNGAETYRVEDTMCRIMAAYNMKNPDAFATTTGIFASVEDNVYGLITIVKRVKQRTINLEKIALVNDLSRNISAGMFTVAESDKRLKEINVTAPPYKWGVKTFFVSIGCGSSCYLFGGSLSDCGAAFIACISYYFLNLYLTERQVTAFLVNIISGALLSVTAILMVSLGIGDNVDKVIIGAIMPLVPGVGITNAVRDIIEGDFLSGSNRVVEAIMIAVAIAVGVGTVLKIYLKLTGTG